MRSGNSSASRTPPADQIPPAGAASAATAAGRPGGRIRVRVRVAGTVQGVGFRPHVYRLAHEIGLDGFVLNDTRGVLVEVEGRPADLDGFVARLSSDAPPLARIERVDRSAVPATGEAGFRIVTSQAGGGRDQQVAPVSPDMTTCDDCLAELTDPDDRRYGYPFTNCTNCGPRFTIVRGVPYDRALTTMAGFKMCRLCQAEYDDPLDRRFHAQPNACPVCGPQLVFLDAPVDPSRAASRAPASADPRPRGPAALSAALAALDAGRILAIKGLGGYHLACRADHEAAVAGLRSRKHREEKPFALMVSGIDAARRLAVVSPVEAELLLGRSRPIVIVARRPDATVAGAVAPASPDLGLMLPYSPLHHLLVGDRDLVMTSGNVSDEPIAFRDEDALERLGPIADHFLIHDRPIHTRTDDSVVRAGLMIRRSRGYVPAALGLPVAAGRPLLACGAELKSTFCLAKDDRAWVSHHIGDLKNWETLSSFREGVAHFERLFAVSPEAVAHDLHPDYLSTREATEHFRTAVEDPPTFAIQHHHAHLAAALAEHGETGPAVGAIYDGSGYGPDGTVWGGEILVGGLTAFERAGHLRPVALPGGDRAAAEPWRMACAWLVEALGDEPAVPASLAGMVDAKRWAAVAGLARKAVRTSSMGRLFDAVAALCGVRAVVTFEGQAAIELEALADHDERRAYPLDADLDPRDLILAVRRDVADGVPIPLVSARFHNAVARGTARAVIATGLDTVVLSGGCFQNRLLTERTIAELRGVRCLLPRQLPPGDGGISFGQAAIAAALLA
ncbi:MAG TPA: carbamoyltransferase HypF [Solirubrobacteraceae bacterium]|jgi:hydrogenase maturation protein HypF|nr:carbamoyltransferase HypF [Solirubrobacteraceae bacterium]